MDTAHGSLAAVFARWALRERAPGVAWGLIRDGELVASGGIGTLRVGEHAPPDADSVFRIASMTKSFTGAALMSLVAEGRLRLDEPVSTYVPELASWRGPTTDAPPLTVRHLVSMESGLPSDDPWADRHLHLPSEGMDELIAEGGSFTWTPGTRFEYSNLGWGLIGRVIERICGLTPQRLVSERLLGPLHLTRTTWLRPDGADVAEPYRWQEDTWRREPEPLGDGTIAPMGGLWSSVGDLARWVAFFCDAWPPRDDPDDGPLPRWARREMQQFRRADTIESVRVRPGGASRSVAFGYGIGLSIRLDPKLGEVVGHSGGLPGYGSHMRWIPDRDLGVVAVSNVSYGDMAAACAEALDVLADRDVLPPATSPAATSALSDAAARAIQLVNDWSDDLALSLFADNVVLDDDLERRAADASGVVARHGALTMEALEVDAPQRGDVVAARGLVRIELELNHQGKVQWWKVLDRTRPSDAPIVTDPKMLAEAPHSAYVLLRPVAALADAFDGWQGEVLDRLAGIQCAVPAAHATCKAFGSTKAPIDQPDEQRIREVVAGWAAATDPIELRAESLELFEGNEQVPVVILAMSESVRDVLTDLWVRCAAAGLPVGHSDHIGAEGWRAHLSLCYPESAPPQAVWEQLRAWMRHVDIGD
ncbi:MAG TPA: serine hydrolase domain-containing protein, partial [Actinomycetota bacterium]|nr:serine hydrolase domain-containing protein [Actinomycetota bacterium]